MSKSSGLGAALLVDEYVLSNDVGAVTQIACPVGQFNVTGLDKEAIERVELVRDGLIDYTPFYNPAADAAHAVLSTLPTDDRITTFLHRNQQGAAAFSLSGKQINYDGNRAATGELTFAVSNVGNGFGAEWGIVLTDDGITTSAGPENLAGWDYGATVGTTAFGLQAYLHVAAITGTDADISIEHSDDDGAGDPYTTVTGATFTTVTGAGKERIATSATESIKRWLRVAITGTYSDLQFLVTVNRNLTATEF